MFSSNANVQPVQVGTAGEEYLCETSVQISDFEDASLTISGKNKDLKHKNKKLWQVRYCKRTF